MPKILLTIFITTCLHGSAFGDLWKAHVAPILQSNCVKCHGGAKKKSGLDLRSVESVLAGGEDADTGRDSARSPAGTHACML